MNRYNQTLTNVAKRYDGKRVFLTTTYPSIPRDSSDTYIVATAADFLDVLADRYYKDITLWWVIAQANGIVGTLKAPSGKEIRIPGNITAILSRFSQVNQ